METDASTGMAEFFDSRGAAHFGFHPEFTLTRKVKLPGKESSGKKILKFSFLKISVSKFRGKMLRLPLTLFRDISRVDSASLFRQASPRNIARAVRGTPISITWTSPTTDCPVFERKPGLEATIVAVTVA